MKNYCQQGFCNSGAKLQSSTVVLRFNFCAKLKIFASIAPPSQSPETLAVSLRRTQKNHENDEDFFTYFNHIFDSFC